MFTACTHPSHAQSPSQPKSQRAARGLQWPSNSQPKPFRSWGFLLIDSAVRRAPKTARQLEASSRADDILALVCWANRIFRSKRESVYGRFALNDYEAQTVLTKTTKWIWGLVCDGSALSACKTCSLQWTVRARGKKNHPLTLYCNNSNIKIIWDRSYANPHFSL